MAEIPARLIQALEGRYSVVEELGEGGMATVYRARETKHDRDVAIKVLKGDVAAAVGAERFLREIQVTARLHHPHILPLHDSGEAAGFLYYVMPMVEGESLAARIAREGPLPIDDALRIAIEVASALSYAHDHDVIHRDIKPDNILLESGNAVVADFGVALVADEAVSAKITSTGMALGTPLYMSPEQSTGHGLMDGRSDIYALGCVLYEMLTGEPPYTGSSAQMIVIKRISDPVPSPRRLRQAVPSDVEQAVMRSLQPTPADRFQTAAVFAEVLTQARSRHQAGMSLEGAGGAGAGGGQTPPFGTAVGSGSADGGRAPEVGVARWMRIAGGVVGLAALAAAGSVALPGVRARLASGDTLGDATFTQVTREPGAELFPSLSRDGGTVVFTRDGDIYMRDLSDGTERALTQDPDLRDTQPALSPDGSSVAFRSEREGGGIFVLEVASGDVRRVTNYGFNPAWSPDGTFLAFAFEGVAEPTTRRGLSNMFVVDLASGQPRQVGEVDGVQPNWSPDGSRIAYWSVMRDGQLTGQRDIWTVDIDGGDPVIVTDDAAIDWSPVWSADGKHLLFSSDRGGSMNVWSIRVDQGTGEALGPPEPVTRGGTGSQEHIAVAAAGGVALFVDRSTTSNIWRVAFDPVEGVTVGEPEPVTRGSNMALEPSVSPDGSRVTFFSLGKAMEMFVARTDGSEVRNLSTPAGRDRSPQWSPDGSRIAFHSDRSGRYQIWETDPEGSAFTQVSRSVAVALYPFWSPDGKRIGYVELGRGVAVADADNPAAGAQTVMQGDVMVRPQWSPDGKKIAGVLSPAAGGTGVVLRDLDSGSMETISRFGDAPQWLPDSRRLVFVAGNRLYLVDARTRAVNEILSAGRDQLGLGSLTPDGRWIYFARTVTEADLWRISWD